MVVSGVVGFVMRNSLVVLCLSGLLVLSAPLSAFHEDGFDRDDFVGPIDHSIGENSNIPGQEQAEQPVNDDKPQTIQSPLITPPANSGENTAAKTASDQTIAKSSLISNNKKTSDVTDSLFGGAFSVGGYVQVDIDKVDQQSVLPSGDPQQPFQALTTSLDSEVNARRARLTLDTDHGLFSAKLSLDAADQVELKDAFVDFALNDYFHIALGQFKVPVGNQSQAYARYGMFMEPTPIQLWMSGQRDRGLLIHNDYTRHGYYYGVGFINGVAENEADNNNKMDLIGRFILNSNSQDGRWKTWFGASYQNGTQTAGSNDEIILLSPLSGDQLFLFDILDSLEYRRERFGLDAVVQSGRFIFTGEYLRDVLNLNQPVFIDGGQFSVGAFVTKGEHVINNGLIDGQKINGSVGGVELAIRMSWFKVDDIFFNPAVVLFDGQGAAVPGIENMQTGGSMAFAINWYINQRHRVSLNYISSQMESVLFPDQEERTYINESAVMLRVQSSF